MSEKVTEELIEEVKPYEFRKLNATDLFPMMRLVSKIGINAFTSIMTNEAMALLTGEEKANGDDDFIKTGALIFEIVQVIVSRLGECEKEIFELLERTSNLSLTELHHLDMDVFVGMVFDFVKKEEFVTFSKAVLKLIK